ncbi:MAG: fimbrillin family protein [Bacteroidales bacterium]|nr:fimbrillin family protein [Bacteroidales bacterium]
MNRIHIIIILAIAILSGCDKHPEPNGGLANGPYSYIFFDAGVVSTKGELVEGETLPSYTGTAFGVMGFRPDGSTPIFDMYGTADDKTESAFDNVAVMYRPGKNAAFRYDELATWHGGEHDFYAYYPFSYTGGAGKAISNIGKSGNRPYVAYTQPAQLNTMTDVMTAYAPDQTASTSAVQLIFNHRLFAFDVVLNNNQSESLRDIIINDAVIQFYEIPESATLYFDTPTVVDSPSGSQTISHDFITSPVTVHHPTGNATSVTYIFNQGSSATANPFLFLPCTALKLKFEVTYVNSWNEVRTFTVDHSSTALTLSGGFQAGHRYALVLNVSDKGQGIEFVPTLVDWTNKNLDIEFN